MQFGQRSHAAAMDSASFIHRPVPGSAHCGDVARAIDILTKLVAQPADVDIDRPLERVALHRPVERVEQSVASQKPAPCLAQSREQAKLGGGAGDVTWVAAMFEL